MTANKELMKKQVLFIQGGGQGAYEADRELAAYLQFNNDLSEVVEDIRTR